MLSSFLSSGLSFMQPSHRRYAIHEAAMIVWATSASIRNSDADGIESIRSDKKNSLTEKCANSTIPSGVI